MGVAGCVAFPTLAGWGRQQCGCVVLPSLAGWLPGPSLLSSDHIQPSPQSTQPAPPLGPFRRGTKMLRPEEGHSPLSALAPTGSTSTPGCSRRHLQREEQGWVRQHSTQKDKPQHPGPQMTPESSGAALTPAGQSQTANLGSATRSASWQLPPAQATGIPNAQSLTREPRPVLLQRCPDCWNRSSRPLWKGPLL